MMKRKAHSWSMYTRLSFFGNSSSISYSSCCWLLMHVQLDTEKFCSQINKIATKYKCLFLIYSFFEDKKSSFSRK